VEDGRGVEIGFHPFIVEVEQVRTNQINSDSPVRIAFWTLGCRLNQYDTEGMRTLLTAEIPVQVVPWDSDADVYVLNSCTVTGKADQECRRLARQVKRKHPGSKVVVAGCYAQTQPDQLQDIPEVDGIVGNTAKDGIVEWLPEIMSGTGKIVKVAEFTPQVVFTSPQIDEFQGRSRAFVKVQDGCNLRCAYCLIWRARGPARSRPLSDVLAQLATLTARGYREVVLAGVHLGGYGRDLSNRTGLHDLLRSVLTTFPALRVRLSSIHPNEITPELLSLWPEFPHLRPHLHISLQSGADSILERMKRPYRSKAARRAVMEIARTIPYCGIGADLIVGFPGETRRDFAESADLVQSLPFSYLHVFRFSARPGTPAAELPGRVHPETVSARSAILRDIAARKQRIFTERLCGQWREAVVEAACDQPNWHHGTTDNYANVRILGHWQEGSLVRCRLEKRITGNLLAGLVQAVDEPQQPGVEASAQGQERPRP